MNIHKPHDSIFKKLMESIDNARDFISFLLPQEVNDHLNLDTLTHAKESFVNKGLEEIISDIVLTCRLKASSDEVHVSILIEHKSRKDKFSSFQILQYLSAGYRIQTLNKKKDQKFKLIIPILYYHNNEKWDFLEVSSFFDHVPIPLAQYIPKLNTLFINLISKSDEELDTIRNVMVSSTLLTQKYAHQPEKLIGKVSQILNKFDDMQGRNFINSLFVYILVVTKMGPEEVSTVVNAIKEPIKEGIMSTYDMIIEKGIVKGASTEKNTNICNAHKSGVPLEMIMNIFKVEKAYIMKVLKENKLT